MGSKKYSKRTKRTGRDLDALLFPDQHKDDKPPIVTAAALARRSLEHSRACIATSTLTAQSSSGWAKRKVLAENVGSSVYPKLSVKAGLRRETRRLHKDDFSDSSDDDVGGALGGKSQVTVEMQRRKAYDKKKQKEKRRQMGTKRGDDMDDGEDVEGSQEETDEFDDLRSEVVLSGSDDNGPLRSEDISGEGRVYDELKRSKDRALDRAGRSVSWKTPSEGARRRDVRASRQRTRLEARKDVQRRLDEATLSVRDASAVQFKNDHVSKPLTTISDKHYLVDETLVGEGNDEDASMLHQDNIFFKHRAFRRPEQLAVGELYRTMLAARGQRHRFKEKSLRHSTLLQNKRVVERVAKAGKLSAGVASSVLVADDVLTARRADEWGAVDGDEEASTVVRDVYSMDDDTYQEVMSRTLESSERSTAAWNEALAAVRSKSRPLASGMRLKGVVAKTPNGREANKRVGSDSDDSEFSPLIPRRTGRVQDGGGGGIRSRTWRRERQRALRTAVATAKESVAIADALVRKGAAERTPHIDADEVSKALLSNVPEKPGTSGMTSLLDKCASAAAGSTLQGALGPGGRRALSKTIARHIGPMYTAARDDDDEEHSFMSGDDESNDSEEGGRAAASFTEGMFDRSPVSKRGDIRHGSVFENRWGLDHHGTSGGPVRRAPAKRLTRSVGPVRSRAPMFSGTVAKKLNGKNHHVSFRGFDTSAESRSWINSRVDESAQQEGQRGVGENSDEVRRATRLAASIVRSRADASARSSRSTVALPVGVQFGRPEAREVIMHGEVISGNESVAYKLLQQQSAIRQDARTSSFKSRFLSQRRPIVDVSHNISESLLQRALDCRANASVRKPGRARSKYIRTTSSDALSAATAAGARMQTVFEANELDSFYKRGPVSHSPASRTAALATHPVDSTTGGLLPSSPDTDREGDHYVGGSAPFREDDTVAWPREQYLERMRDADDDVLESAAHILAKVPTYSNALQVLSHAKAVERRANRPEPEAVRLARKNQRQAEVGIKTVERYGIGNYDMARKWARAAPIAKSVSLAGQVIHQDDSSDSDDPQEHILKETALGLFDNEPTMKLATLTGGRGTVGIVEKAARIQSTDSTAFLGQRTEVDSDTDSDNSGLETEPEATPERKPSHSELVQHTMDRVGSASMLTPLVFARQQRRALQTFTNSDGSAIEHENKDMTATILTRRLNALQSVDDKLAASGGPSAGTR